MLFKYFEGRPFDDENYTIILAVGIGEEGRAVKLLVTLPLVDAVSAPSTQQAMVVLFECRVPGVVGMEEWSITYATQASAWKP